MPLTQCSPQKQIETFLPELSRFPVFKNCTTNQILDLLNGATMRSTKHRGLLYRIADPANSFSLVLRGAYKLVRPTPKGEDVIVFFAGPGDVIAALVMPQLNSVYPVSAISMGPSLVLEIPRITYVNYWAKNIEIVMLIQNLLYNRMVLLQDQKLFNKNPLPQRVGRLLLQLIEKYSNDSEGILPIPLTRKEIADSLGSTVESVIRIMSEWSHRGLINTTEHHIEILDPGQIIKLMEEQ